MPQLLVRQKDSLVQLAIYKISKILNCQYINHYNHELEITFRYVLLYLIMLYIGENYLGGITISPLIRQRIFENLVFPGDH